MTRNEPELPEPGLRVQLGERRNGLPVILQTLGLGPGDSCASGRGALDDLPFLSEWELGGCLPVPLWGSGRAQIALTLLDRLLPA